VVEGSIVATGWNGVRISPDLDCVAAGCLRCKVADTVTGIGYDRCLCVHAEQAAIADAAKNGGSLYGAILFNTLRPCLSRAANALIAGVEQVVHQTEWRYADQELEEAPSRLRAKFKTFVCVVAKPQPSTLVKV